jgi:hypothetical protein
MTERPNELVDALTVIARGTTGDKLHWIATHDPDLYVAHVLEWGIPYDDRKAAPARRRPLDHAVLDEVIARISLAQSALPRSA